MAPCPVKGRNGRSYRYYRCRAHQQHAKRCPTGLLPADALERAVAAQVVVVGNDPMTNVLPNAAASPLSGMAVPPAGNVLLGAWPMLPVPERCRLLRSLVREVRVERGQLRVALKGMPARSGRAVDLAAARA